MEDRRERPELADYTGLAKRFKYYSFKVFKEELSALRGDLTPDSASERDFVTCLGRTSENLANHTHIRTSADVFGYRGPQSVAHRSDLARLSFEPSPQVFGTHRGLTRDEVFPAFLCSDCGKCRRVDASTRRVLGNEAWHLDRAAGLRRRLLAADAERVWADAEAKGFREPSRAAS